MTKLLSYLFVTIGLIGFLFFLNYNGKTIPLKELWFVLCIFTVIIGAYFIVKAKLTTQSLKLDNSDLFRIDRLKETGEKIKITLDNSEVKTRSYQQEIVNEGVPSQAEMLDALYDANINYKSQTITQNYIVFLKQYRGKTFKFTSQPIVQDAGTLRRYIEQQHGIYLYVDKQDPKNYFFDLPFL